MNMPDSHQPDQRFPVKLTQAQRTVIAEILPELTQRLNLTEAAQRTIPLTSSELKSIKDQAGRTMRATSSGVKKNSLRHVVELTAKALESTRGIRAIPVSSRLDQFKVTLRSIAPAIWRRIQVKDCTLDKLHERIQTAMGWTNSHLYHFRVGEQRYGDPLLMQENFGERGYEDSTVVKFGEIQPKAGTRFAFEYEYDFGDGWRHEVVFEGCLRSEAGGRYPLCLDGARNCPPEDVGGTPGYAEFLDAISDPAHEQHNEFLTWVVGAFDPEEFDAAATTRRMQRGLPDRRRMESTLRADSRISQLTNGPCEQHPTVSPRGIAVPPRQPKPRSHPP